MRFIVNKFLTPIIAVAAILIALYTWNLHNQTKIRLDQIIELSTEINNSKKITTNVDSLRNVITQMEFERQSYTSNLDLMSNWFILFETILFGIFFLVGYGIFDNKIADSYEKSKTAYKDIHERYVQFETEFKDIKYEVYKSIANLNMVIAIQGMDMGAKDNIKEFPSSLFYWITSLEYANKSIITLPDKVNPKNIDNCKVIFRGINKKMSAISPKDVENILTYYSKENKENYEMILKSINYISSNGDQEIKDFCSEFMYLLNTTLKQ